jgi:dTDP-4-amino-4,6-dideoxygalactose transaminase
MVIRVPYVDLPAQHRPLEEEILVAVRKVLAHGQFILGPEVEAFEEAMARYLGVPHVVGVASGTDALVLALRLRGIGAGHEVLLPSHSFVATAHAVALAGAAPVFVDVEAERLLMDPAGLENALSDRTRALMPVHLGGHPCDMDALTAFSREHGLDLVEDCAQAVGTRWRGRSVGDFGLGCFSLHPLKTLSAPGDGGFLTVHDPAEVERLGRMRNLGLRDRDHADEISGHSRLDTLHAAILLVKLRHLDAYLEARRSHAAAYREALDPTYRLIPVPPEAEPSHSTFVVRHPERNRILREVGAKGFDVKVHYPVPIHRQAPYGRNRNRHLPETDRAAAEIMSLPVTPELGVGDRDRLIDVLLDAAS